MAFTILDQVGASSGSAGTTLDFASDLSEAGENDDVFVHIMFANPDAAITDEADFTVLSTTAGPTYSSALLHATLAATPDVEITWTGSSHYAYHLVSGEGLDGSTPVDSSVSTPSLGAAVLTRLTDLPDRDEVHMLCFAGCMNLQNAITAKANTDVGWLETLDLENDETAGHPVCWLGQFNGPLGDTDVTLNAAVYFDPPPTHSVGHVVALALA